MEELKRDQLLELGFREDWFDDKRCLTIHLNRGSDRFYHRLRWYEDEPEVLYIDCFKLSGWETIEEIDFFRDINGLSSSAINHYTKILKRLEIW